MLWCPLLNKLKKKAMVATQDDSDEESSDEEDSQEVSNLALMAIEDESFDESNKVNDLPTYNELYEAFKELFNDMMKIDKKNACLKNKMLELSNENDDLQKCNDLLN